MKLTDLKMKLLKETKSKGFTQKTTNVIRKGKKFLTLKNVKELGRELDKQAIKTGMKYIIRGRNKLGTTTIRGYDGRYYDEDEDYYENKNVDRDTYDDFYYIDVVSVVNNKK